MSNRLPSASLAVWLGAALLLPCAAQAYDPVVTSNTLITDERRLALVEGKIASLQKQLDLVEDSRAVERLQQAWGHYVNPVTGKPFTGSP